MGPDVRLQHSNGIGPATASGALRML